MITEDRLSAAEFFSGCEVTDFAVPDEAKAEALSLCVAQDDEEAYLRTAVDAWITEFPYDPFSDEGRLALGERLLHHGFLQALITCMGGNYHQESALIEALGTQYPFLRSLSSAHTVLDALFSLISHARTGSAGKLRPFLFVQVQLWLRELRRLLGKVSGEKVTYAIEYDLNAQQKRQYLPVVNCRDCGASGWVSLLNERQNAAIVSLDTFYNRYFKCDDKSIMMFPYSETETPAGTETAKLCPECLQVRFGDKTDTLCANCGAETISVYVPVSTAVGSGDNRQYVCPCCGSRSGLSLMGLRSATEISAGISQIFASKFNDDKKTLAFSDNVQDAAHRAGFFNARTWRFGLRTAIQKYVQDGGADKPFDAFLDGFIAYYSRMKDEEFVSSFIAPNMTWMKTYETMLADRELRDTRSSRSLIADIERRLRYEIMQEYGMASGVGRTLEKSGCSCIAFDRAVIESTAACRPCRTKRRQCADTCRSERPSA